MSIITRGRPLAAAILTTALLGGCSNDAPELPAKLACQVGAWTFDSGETMVLAPANGNLRYRFLDGRIGLFRAEDDQGRYAALEGWRQDGPTGWSSNSGTALSAPPRGWIFQRRTRRSPAAI